MDKNLPHQQHVENLPFAVVVFRAKSNRIEDARAVILELLCCLVEFKSVNVYVLAPPEP